LFIDADMLCLALADSRSSGPALTKRLRGCNE